MNTTNEYFESSKQVIVLKDKCKVENGYLFYFEGVPSIVPNKTVIFQSTGLSVRDLFEKLDLYQIESLHIQES